MRLDLNLILLKEVPIFTILKARLYEYAVLVRREVLTANDLPNEMHLGLEIGLCARISTKLLYLVNLLLLKILQSLLFSFGHGISSWTSIGVIVVVGIVAGLPSISIILQLTECIVLNLLLVVLTHIIAGSVHFD